MVKYLDIVGELSAKKNYYKEKNPFIVSMIDWLLARAINRYNKHNINSLSMGIRNLSFLRSNT
ncbi:hypothetical protein [Acinetobacter baumannii]|uniref:hypothetical protein n=1 Tax=Acinetobacter baumannii TaxID=470 RepID=UPI00406BF2F9